MVERKIILFGGTFDPIHLGHTLVAAAASEFIGAEKTIFIPAKRSPLKASLPRADDNHRLKMVNLAIADSGNFQLSDYELNRPEPTFTYQTVSHFQKEFGGEISIYWLVGADSIDELPLWHQISDLIDVCNLAVIYRAGFPKPDFTGFDGLWGRRRIEKLQKNVIETPLIDISSTKIREKLAAGLDVTDMLAPAVADYIRKHHLYR